MAMASWTTSSRASTDACSMTPRATTTCTRRSCSTSPVGEGVEFTFGKFATPIGAEVADASKNWAVTRGNTYNLLQPIDHLGLMASTDIGPVTIGAGVVNQINLLTSSADVNSEKSYLGRIAASRRATCSASRRRWRTATRACGVHRHRRPREVRPRRRARELQQRRVLGLRQRELRLGRRARPARWGVSVAGMVPITDALSAGLRLEYVRDKNGSSRSCRHATARSTAQPARLAYEIAENLTIKTEVRWDKVNENADGVHEFFSDEEYSPPDANNGTEDQVVGLAQVVYAF